MPGPRAWGAMVGLALLCTGIAYILYFRLIASRPARRGRWP
jgi:drug/metabolite transporter (DMT)-like permease